MLDILQMLGALIASFVTQSGIVLMFVSWIKEAFNISGNTVRVVSFVVGLVLGALFLWPWIVLNPGMHVSFYVLISVLFLIVSGLVASGYYDYKNEL